MIPNYVVIPVKENPAELPAICEQADWSTIIPNSACCPHGTVHNGGHECEFNLSAKWNAGLEWAAKQAAEDGFSRYNVAIVNDDIEPAPDLLEQLAKGLDRHRSEKVWISYPNIYNVTDNCVAVNPSYAGQTIAGWCFMLRGELGLRFDEQFRWYYGDSDLEKQVRQAGGVPVCVAAAHARHLNPNESTRTNPELLQLAREDEQRFANKWGINPTTLFLAMNPTWGEA